MFRSATFKLTLWYLAIVVLISLFFSFTLYQVVAHELAGGLHRESVRITKQFPVFDNNPTLMDTDDYKVSIHQVLFRLIGFNIIVFIVAGAASYWLACRTLEPIEAAHEQQKRFTADVSHELRTPLAAMRIETEVGLLGTTQSTKDLSDILTSNLEEVSTMETLIANLLRLSQLDEQAIQIDFTPVELETALTAAISVTAPAARQRNITIHNSTTEGLMFGDRENLTQLFIIFLDNAIKYSPQGSEILVSGGHTPSKTVIAIQDHGVGISKDNLEHIFERFYRADASRSKATTGFGLGLSIAKLIADAHNGDVTLTSQPNKGTTATITIPNAPNTP
jgi:two-component system sensor histidine kinase CiaH